MEKIILDCDPGHDDAVAILMAGIHPSIQLLGITTVAGNQTLNKTTINALNVCKYLNIDVNFDFKDLKETSGKPRYYLDPTPIAITKLILLKI